MIDSPAHRKLALEAARKSIVLLKNDGFLPLKKLGRIAVIGPNADDRYVPLSNAEIRATRSRFWKGYGIWHPRERGSSTCRARPEPKGW